MKIVCTKKCPRSPTTQNGWQERIAGTQTQEGCGYRSFTNECDLSILLTFSANFGVKYKHQLKDEVATTRNDVSKQNVINYYRETSPGIRFVVAKNKINKKSKLQPTHIRVQN